MYIYKVYKAPALPPHALVVAQLSRFSALHRSRSQNVFIRIAIYMYLADFARYREVRIRTSAQPVRHLFVVYISHEVVPSMVVPTATSSSPINVAHVHSIGSLYLLISCSVARIFSRTKSEDG